MTLASTRSPGIALTWHGHRWELGPNADVLCDGEVVYPGPAVEIAITDAGVSVVVPDGRQYLLGWSLVTPPTTPPGHGLPVVQAHPAAAFVESVGVTTHLNYHDTAYYKDWPTVRDLLVQSGIRHVREGIPRMGAWYYDRIKEWHAAGVQCLGMLGKANLAELDAMVANMPPMEAIEGVNEWDLNGGPNWVADLRAYQPQFYAAAKAHGLQVLGPSLTSSMAFDALGDLSVYMDWAQLHNYYGTRHPETPGWGDDGYGSLDWSKRQSAKIAPGVPIWTVETGYPTDPQCEPAMPDRDMPEAACVRYLTRLLCEQFAQGIPRTYLYQFVEDFQSNGPVDAYATHGLVRADGSPKATYHAVANLIAAVGRAPGPAGTLGYTLTGASPDLRQLLLHTADQRFLLLVWLGCACMHPDTRQMYPEVAPVPVTLALDPAYQVARTVRMGDDGQWAPCDLSAGDQVTLVEIGKA